jgi:hypothetical protein
MVRIEDLPSDSELSDTEYERIAMIEKYAEQRKQEGFSNIKNPFECIFNKTRRQFSDTMVRDTSSDSKYTYKDDDEQDITTLKKPTHKSIHRRIDMSNTRSNILESDEKLIYPYKTFDESNLDAYFKFTDHIPLEEQTDETLKQRPHKNTISDEVSDEDKDNALNHQHETVNFLCNANGIDSNNDQNININDSYFNHLSSDVRLNDIYSTILKYHFVSVQNLYNPSLPKIGKVKISHNNELYKCWLHGWQSSVSFEQEIKNRRLLSSPKLCIFVRDDITLDVLCNNQELCRQPNTWIYAIWTIENTYHILDTEDVLNYFIPFDMLTDETFQRLPSTNCCQIILHDNDKHIIEYLYDQKLDDDEQQSSDVPPKIWYGVPILPPEYYTYMKLNIHDRVLKNIAYQNNKQQQKTKVTHFLLMKKKTQRISFF